MPTTSQADVHTQFEQAVYPALTMEGPIFEPIPHQNNVLKLTVILLTCMLNLNLVGGVCDRLLIVVIG